MVGKKEHLLSFFGIFTKKKSVNFLKITRIRWR